MGEQVLLDNNSFIDEYKTVPEIRHFLTPEGKDIYSDWHRKLRDTKAKIALDRRINRIELGELRGPQVLPRRGMGTAY